MAQRAAMGESARLAASAIICDKILAQPAYQRAKCIAGFAPMDEEVNIWPILEDAYKNGKTVALPRVVSVKSRQINFHQFSGKSLLVAGFKGISEPTPNAPRIFSQLFDFLLVPAVAIGKNQIRLGYGGGFYDIFLSNLAGVVSFAPIFHCQFVNKIPSEAHDQRVNFTITEE